MWYSSQNPVTEYFVVWSVTLVHWYLILISVLVIRVTPTNPATNQITQGASGLDGKPGARVSQCLLVLLQRVCGCEFCASDRTFRLMCSHEERRVPRIGVKQEGGQRQWQKRGRWTEHGLRLYGTYSLNYRTCFWNGSSDLDYLLGDKNSQSNWHHYLRILADFSITNGISCNFRREALWRD